MALLVLGSACAYIAADDPPPKSPPVISVPSPTTDNESQASQSPKSDDSLLSVVRGEDPLAAIQAAWELASRTGIQFKDIRPGYPTPMNKAKTGWFVGVLDCKLPCLAPRWWCYEVENAEYVETPMRPNSSYPSQHSFSMTDENSPFQDIEPDDDEHRSRVIGNSFFSNDRLAKQIVFERDDHKITLPFELVTGDANKELPQSDTPRVFLINDDVLYFCEAFTDRCDVATLYAFDAVAKKVLWSSVLQCGKPPGDGREVFSTRHFVDIARSDDGVYVFGVHRRGAYIERLDIKTGVHTWRFSTE